PKFEILASDAGSIHALKVLLPIILVCRYMVLTKEITSSSLRFTDFISRAVILLTSLHVINIFLIVCLAASYSSCTLNLRIRDVIVVLEKTRGEWRILVE
ncbi:hypothetical protein L9F63_022870, partial [Diploptera punctata]